MNEELRKTTERLLEDEIAVQAYKYFLESKARKRYFGYVDKRELKRLCKDFNYTDARSFIKGGITAAVIIWVLSKFRKNDKTEPVQDNNNFVDYEIKGDNCE